MGGLRQCKFQPHLLCSNRLITRQSMQPVLDTVAEWMCKAFTGVLSKGQGKMKEIEHARDML